MSRFLKSQAVDCFDGKIQMVFKPQTLGMLVEADEFALEFELLIEEYNVKSETKQALISIAGEYAALLTATESVKVLQDDLDGVTAAFVKWLTELDLDEADYGDLWAVRLELPNWIVAEWSRAYLESQRLNPDKASSPADLLSEADKEALQSKDSPLA